MDALKQLKLAKNGYIIMSCIRIDKDSGIFFQRYLLSGISV